MNKTVSNVGLIQRRIRKDIDGSKKALEASKKFIASGIAYSGFTDGVLAQLERQVAVLERLEQDLVSDIEKAVRKPQNCVSHHFVYADVLLGDDEEDQSLETAP